MPIYYKGEPIRRAPQIALAGIFALVVGNACVNNFPIIDRILTCHVARLHNLPACKEPQ